MQCYSLVTRLKRDFPNCIIEVIDYTSEKILSSYEQTYARIKDIKIKESVEKRKQMFLECQKTLPLSNAKFICNDTDEVIKYMNKNYDAVVVGSDAVWNWVIRGFPNLYFLKDYKGKKFSYAASIHGMNYQNITENQKDYLRDAFSDFKYIGVRDITTENMVNYVESTVKPSHNCDPTAFLDLESIPCETEKLIKKLEQRGLDFSKPLVGIMANDLIGYEIKKKYKNKIQLISLFEPNKYADIHLYDLSPFEWAKVFSFFKVTLTHFFHGTMLSLVNGVPVIPIEFVNEFSSKNKTKIKDVMERLDLLSWRFEADYRNHSFIQKVLQKSHLKKDSSLWNPVCELIDDFLVSDYRELIKSRLFEESKSYGNFYDALKSNIK